MGDLSKRTEASTDQNGPLRGSRGFAATHWSVVLAARGEDSPKSAAALDQLCQTYWYPLYAYIRARGFDSADAQDLTQGFFARLLGGKSLMQADPGKGHFRSFLLGAVNHYLVNEWRHAHAAKRGGAKTILSLDDTAEVRYAQEPSSNLTPEKLYERRWALSLFERALRRVHEEYIKAAKGEVYDALKNFLSDEPNEGEYIRVGAQLDLNSNAVASAVYRLRQHYRQCVREEIAHTVSGPDELEDEMRSLLAALAE